jgi:hypothetical protein
MKVKMVGGGVGYVKLTSQVCSGTWPSGQRKPGRRQSGLMFRFLLKLRPISSQSWELGMDEIYRRSYLGSTRSFFFRLKETWTREKERAFFSGLCLPAMRIPHAAAGSSSSIKAPILKFLLTQDNGAKLAAVREAEKSESSEATCRCWFRPH